MCSLPWPSLGPPNKVLLIPAPEATLRRRKPKSLAFCWWFLVYSLILPHFYSREFCSHSRDFFLMCLLNCFVLVERTEELKKKRHPRLSEERKNTVLINVFFNTLLSATFRTAFNKTEKKLSQQVLSRLYKTRFSWQLKV